jgi:FHA domain
MELPMSLTVLLTAVLPVAVWVASALTIPVSLLLLRMYRKAVQKGMSSSGGGMVPGKERDLVREKPSSSLQIRTFDHASKEVRRGEISPAYSIAVQRTWQVAAVYAAAGACYACIMTAGWLMATRANAVPWTEITFHFLEYLWPTIIGVVLVAAYDHTRRCQLFGSYFLVLLALGEIAVAHNSKLSIAQVLLLWITANALPTVVVIASVMRPIRAVGPLVLVFLIMISIGSLSLLSMISLNNALLGVVVVGLRLGLNSTTVFVGLIIFGMLIFALPGWWLLRLLGRFYEEKKLSDQSIMLDALWLLFGFVQSIGLVFESPPWILTGVVAFLGYKLVARIGLRWTVGVHPVKEPRSLLLLRVFALGKRSEKFFDKLRKHWQYAGSIAMIAGPDLVTSTVEPHEFLKFVRGQISRRFVSNGQDLERRIAAWDDKPDPDGRYQLKEFFCHDDTWQITMERLATVSDAILMDLRSFSPANRGCIFELTRLLDRIDLRRVVFIVDDTTDLAFLETTLLDLWQRLSADSPNQTVRRPILQCFRSVTQSEKELSGLLYLLMRTLAAPEAVLIGVSGPLEGKRFTLEKYGVRIGRNPDNDLVIPQDNFVSGRHAYLEYEKNRFLIVDGHSRNGTFVNDKQVTDGGRVLSSGDRIRIGHSTFEVKILES